MGFSALAVSPPLRIEGVAIQQATAADIVEIMLTLSAKGGRSASGNAASDVDVNQSAGRPAWLFDRAQRADQRRAYVEATLADKGNWFRSLTGSDSRKPEWRSALDFPVEVLAREARSADLVVIGQRRGQRGAYRSLVPGEAILKMGRPTLVVPEGVGLLRAEHVVIGWKDTREARHAVRDALPFLQRATRVSVIEACGTSEKTALGRLDDVARYLTQHRVEGGPKVMLEQEGSGAAQLIRIAQDERADLLVTGAYGHSRLGEWIFGGMTRELLATSPICCLMSH
jgi:nucleotide-binding universal stress UspA family protein